MEFNLSTGEYYRIQFW